MEDSDQKGLPTGSSNRKGLPMGRSDWKGLPTGGSDRGADQMYGRLCEAPSAVL